MFCLTDSTFVLSAILVEFIIPSNIQYVKVKPALSDTLKMILNISADANLFEESTVHKSNGLLIPILDKSVEFAFAQSDSI